MTTRLTLTALAIYGIASASTAQTVKPFEREVQIYGATNLSAMSERNLSNFGVQCKKKLHGIVYYKIGGFLTSLTERGNPRYDAIAADSVRARTLTTNATLGGMSLAIEAERHFYKRVHLAAGAEIRGGYGSGGIDSGVAYYNHSIGSGTGAYHSSTQHDEVLRISMLQLRPYVGARMYFGRLSMGLDLGPVSVMTNRANKTRRTSTFDMNLFTVSGSFTAGYRL